MFRRIPVVGMGKLKEEEKSPKKKSPSAHFFDRSYDFSISGYSVTSAETAPTLESDVPKTELIYELLDSLRKKMDKQPSIRPMEDWEVARGGFLKSLSDSKEIDF